MGKCSVEHHTNPSAYDLCGHCWTCGESPTDIIRELRQQVERLEKKLTILGREYWEGGDELANDRFTQILAPYHPAALEGEQDAKG